MEPWHPRRVGRMTRERGYCEISDNWEMTLVLTRVSCPHDNEWMSQHLSPRRQEMGLQEMKYLHRHQNPKPMRGASFWLCLTPDPKLCGTRSAGCKETRNNTSSSGSGKSQQTPWEVTRFSFYPELGLLTKHLGDSDFQLGKGKKKRAQEGNYKRHHMHHCVSSVNTVTGTNEELTLLVGAESGSPCPRSQWLASLLNSAFSDTILC